MGRCVSLELVEYLVGLQCSYESVATPVVSKAALAAVQWENPHKVELN